MHLYEVIKRPIVTEKALNQSETVHQYTFEVDMRANKHQIKQAVEAAFPNVTVLRVNVAVMPPKRGHYGRRVITKEPAWKKAVVTLAPGQTIQFFEGV